MRLIDSWAAQQLASIRLFDRQFKRRRIYVAFDNLGDRDIFTRGIQLLLDAGFRGDDILAYMLVGFDPKETWDRIAERLEIMLALGVRPYPMPYLAVNGRSGNGLDPKRLRAFQRYCTSRQYHFRSFAEYEATPYAKRASFSDHTASRQSTFDDLTDYS